MSCSCHCECAVPSDSIATTDDSQAACIRIIKYDASCFQASEVRHYSLSFKALLLLLLLILTFVTLRILCHQSDSGHAPETSVLTAVLPPTAYSRTARGHSRAATSPSSVAFVPETSATPCLPLYSSHLRSNEGHYYTIRSAALTVPALTDSITAERITADTHSIANITPVTD